MTDPNPLNELASMFAEANDAASLDMFFKTETDVTRKRSLAMFTMQLSASLNTPDLFRVAAAEFGDLPKTLHPRFLTTALGHGHTAFLSAFAPFLTQAFVPHFANWVPHLLQPSTPPLFTRRFFELLRPDHVTVATSLGFPAVADAMVEVITPDLPAVTRLLSCGAHRQACLLAARLDGVTFRSIVTSFRQTVWCSPNPCGLATVLRWWCRMGRRDLMMMFALQSKNLYVQRVLVRFGFEARGCDFSPFLREPLRLCRSVFVAAAAQRAWSSFAVVASSTPSKMQRARFFGAVTAFRIAA